MHVFVLERFDWCLYIREVLQMLVLEKCDNCLYIRGATCVCIRE